jgi:hypothetical protein
MSIETPKFSIVQKDNKFEIREYQEYINASVEIESDYKSAINDGFSILADYIFGNNWAKSRIEMTAPVTGQATKSEKIGMTAPVTAAKIGESKKIGMTAPVTAAKLGESKKYLISFTMPAKYSLESLPEPTNKTISIHKVAAHKAVALKFSGYLNEKINAKKTQEMEEWLKTHNLQAKDDFMVAQYNPPWILGPFRKNEIIAKVS